MMKGSSVYGGMSDSSTSTTSAASCTLRDGKLEWEMRPGGMLVQKREEKIDVPPVILRLRIAYGALRYDISVESQATFGELKKLVMAETGLDSCDQRLMYRGKEHKNGEYLDTCGLKDRSKLVLIEDPASIERRYIEARKNARIQSANRAISSVSMEVDKLAQQVSAIEKAISNGIKVPEVQITTLIEMLMRQAIKLDGISAEGDATAFKLLQSNRVQKCVEALDVLKISNAKVKPVIATTKWEKFDPPLALPQWELFD